MFKQKGGDNCAEQTQQIKDLDEKVSVLKGDLLEKTKGSAFVKDDSVITSNNIIRLNDTIDQSLVDYLTKEDLSELKNEETLGPLLALIPNEDKIQQKLQVVEDLIQEKNEIRRLLKEVGNDKVDGKDLEASIKGLTDSQSKINNLKNTKLCNKDLFPDSVCSSIDTYFTKYWVGYASKALELANEVNTEEKFGRPTPELEHPITKKLTQLCNDFIDLNRLAPKVEDAEETLAGGRRRKLKGGALDLPEPEASVPNYDIFQTLGKGMYYYHLHLLQLERALRVNHAVRYNIFNKAYTTVVPYFKEQLENYQNIVPTLEALEQSRCLYVEGWGADVEDKDTKGISKKRVDQSPYCDIEIKEGTESKSHRFGTATSKYLPNELEPKIDALEKAIEAASTAGFLADQLTEFKDEVSSLKKILDANNEEIKQNIEKATNSWGERKITKQALLTKWNEGEKERIADEEKNASQNALTNFNNTIGDNGARKVTLCAELDNIIKSRLGIGPDDLKKVTDYYDKPDTEGNKDGILDADELGAFLKYDAELITDIGFTAKDKMETKIPKTDEDKAAGVTDGEYKTRIEDNLDDLQDDCESKIKSLKKTLAKIDLATKTHEAKKEGIRAKNTQDNSNLDNIYKSKETSINNLFENIDSYTRIIECRTRDKQNASAEQKTEIQHQIENLIKFGTKNEQEKTAEILGEQLDAPYAQIGWTETIETGTVGWQDGYVCVSLGDQASSSEESSTATVVPSTEPLGSGEDQSGSVASSTEPVAQETGGDDDEATIIFKKMDQDHNGKLIKKEIREYIQQNNLYKQFGVKEPGSGEDGPGHSWETLTKAIDQAGKGGPDGSIDLEDFQAFYNGLTTTAGKRKTSLKRNAQKKSLRRNKQIHNKIRKTRKNRNQKKSISKRR